jgi:hypothetical protein
VRADVAYRAEKVDPFAPVGLQVDPAQDRGPRATAAMMDALRNFGVELERTPSIATAGTMLQELTDRRRKGLCSYKQARWLTKQGLRGDVSGTEAREIMERSKANGWRVPADLRSTYGRDAR